MIRGGIHDPDNIVNATQRHDPAVAQRLPPAPLDPNAPLLSVACSIAASCALTRESRTFRTSWRWESRTLGMFRTRKTA